MNYVAFDYLLAVLALGAAVRNVAVKRSPSVPEPAVIDAMRNLRAAGWLCISARVFWVLHNSGDWPAPIYTLAPLVAITAAECISCLVRLATPSTS